MSKTLGKELCFKSFKTNRSLTEGQLIFSFEVFPIFDVYSTVIIPTTTH